MAKNKKRTIRRYFKRAVHRARKMTIPVAIVGGMLPGVTAIATSANASGWGGAGRLAGLIYTGYDYTTNKWSIRNMQLGLMPLAIGVIIHKVAGMLGINKAIASTGIPLIRI